MENEFEEAIYDQIEVFEEEGLSNEAIVSVLEKILADRKSIK